MKFQVPSIFAAALMAGSAAAHSWLDCVETNVTNYDAAKADPNVTPSTACTGYPRNKVHNGDWISESSYYAWNLYGDANTEGLACHPTQTDPTYPSGVPMTTAVPGQKIRMRFWGNGHTRWDIGSPNHRDPGLIRIYWAGQKETEITSRDDLTETNWMRGAQANFSADTVTLITGNTMNEKANYFDLTLPDNIENGRHSMVWVWAWEQSLLSGLTSLGYDKSWKNTYSTCFDIMIVDSDYEGQTYDDAATVAADEQEDEDEESPCLTETAYKGGMTNLPCTGSDCPPCWYKNAVTGVLSCYDYTSGTTCPWGGAYDCKQNKQIRRALKHERSPFV